MDDVTSVHPLLTLAPARRRLDDNRLGFKAKRALKAAAGRSGLSLQVDNANVTLEVAAVVEEFKAEIAIVRSSPAFAVRFSFQRAAAVAKRQTWRLLRKVL